MKYIIIRKTKIDATKMNSITKFFGSVSRTTTTMPFLGSISRPKTETELIQAYFGTNQSVAPKVHTVLVPQVSKPKTVQLPVSFSVPCISDNILYLSP